MKKPFFVIAMAFAMTLVGCSKSPEEKAETMIAEVVRSTLYIPESYDPVETYVDSAFSPFDDPEFVGFMIDAQEDLNQLDSDLSRCEVDIELSEDYKTAGTIYGINHYNRQKKQYDEAVAQKSELENKIKDLKLDIKERIEKEPEFIGFKAAHRFRAKNNAGMVLMGDIICIFDKDMSQIVAVFDMDNIEIKNYNEFLEAINDGNIRLDE